MKSGNLSNSNSSSEEELRDDDLDDEYYDYYMEDGSGLGMIDEGPLTGTKKFQQSSRLSQFG